ncbi:MAG: DUF3078 domain-containing protein [Bacteroidota bacterium]
MRNLGFALVAFFMVSAVFSQTLEDLKLQQKAMKDSITAIQGRVDALQGKIDAFPGWKFGVFGTVGANVSGFNNWYAQGTPNNDAGNIGITLNGLANLDRDKFFWRNSLNMNLQWVKLDNKDIDTDSDSFDGTTDVFNITSLYGYKLSDKFALSALGEYRTTFINNFNDPGYLDLGIGATWTPITDLVVVVHPLNYNFVFSSEDDIFQSSLGAKILVDYTRQIGKINFKTNFSSFQSYESSDLSNWTWINSFGYTLWKGIGLGFEFGLRSNRQEALNFIRNTAPTPDPDATFDSIDNDLQSYWLFGLNYSF